MKQYKVQTTKSFVIGVQAENEEQAKEIAEKELWDAEHENTAHYFQSGDVDVVVFDVTGTDDADDIITAQ